MSQFFRGRGEADSNRQLERELKLLEAQAQEASSGYETQFLNRAGNLCVEGGQPRRALGYFGRAIDAYLESGRFSAAEVLCRKLLKIAPDAVRARCTLAWLSLGKGYRSETDREVEDYVHAAQKAGNESLAAKQRVMMAQATPSSELREHLAERLVELGAEEEADLVYGLVFAERNDLREPVVADEGKLWQKLLRAALMSPQELNAHGFAAMEDESESGDQYLPALTRDETP
jgi:tetratricopeptide (TPR) repeat protein